MHTRRWLVVAGLGLLSAGTVVSAVKLGPSGASQTPVNTPAGKVTITRAARVTPATADLPALAGCRLVAGYRYEVRDAHGGLICNLSRVELVVARTPRQVATEIARARGARNIAKGKVITAWWGSPADAAVATISPHGRGALLVAERAVRKQQAPRLPQ